MLAMTSLTRMMAEIWVRSVSSRFATSCICARNAAAVSSAATLARKPSAARASTCWAAVAALSADCAISSTPAFTSRNAAVMCSAPWRAVSIWRATCCSRTLVRATPMAERWTTVSSSPSKPRRSLPSRSSARRISRARGSAPSMAGGWASALRPSVRIVTSVSSSSGSAGRSSSCATGAVGLKRNPVTSCASSPDCNSHSRSSAQRAEGERAPMV